MSDKCMPEITIHIGQPGQSNFSTINIEWFDEQGRKQSTAIEIQVINGETRTLDVRVNRLAQRCYPLAGESWTKEMLLPRLHIGGTYRISPNGNPVSATLTKIDDRDGAEFVEDGGNILLLAWSFMLENPPCSPNQMGYWKAEA